jgi:hypothetical protein
VRHAALKDAVAEGEAQHGIEFNAADYEVGLVVERVIATPSRSIQTPRETYVRRG